METANNAALGFLSQFTAEQLRAQYARNLVGLRRDLERARATGRKVRGYTEAELQALVERFERLAGVED